MKRNCLKSLVFLAVTLILAASCSRDGLIPGDDFMPTASGEFLKHGMHCNVFCVPPSGGDDTENLIRAFADAKAAGPGSVVRLLPGNYTIREIEVREFYGEFSGAGIGKTVITSSEYLLCGENFDDNSLAHLLKFIGCDIMISDMTIKMRDGYACSDVSSYGEHDLNALLVLADYSDIFRPGVMYIKALVNNVEFIGGIDDGSGACGPANTGIAIWAGAAFWYTLDGKEYPLSRGDVKIVNCSFNKFLGSMEAAYFGSEGKVVFKNNISKDQMITFFAGFNFGAKIQVSGNTCLNNSWMDLWIDDDDWGEIPYVPLSKRTEYDIFNNRLYPAEGCIGIILTDSRIVQYPDNYLPQLIRVSNNFISMKPSCTGIYSWNSQNALIAGNRFTGEGSTGILVDGYVAANKNIMTGNNFSSATFANAAIILGENSVNCLVAGSGNATVIDNGTGNKITGMRRPEGKPGHFIPGHQQFRALKHRLPGK